MNDEHVSLQTLYLYLDGELQEGRRWAVATHLAICSTCCKRLARAAELKAALRQQLGREAAPPALRGAVVAHIRSQPRRIWFGSSHHGGRVVTGAVVILL